METRWQAHCEGLAKRGRETGPGAEDFTRKAIYRAVLRTPCSIRSPSCRRWSSALGGLYMGLFGLDPDLPGGDLRRCLGGRRAPGCSTTSSAARPWLKSKRVAKLRQQSREQHRHAEVATFDLEAEWQEAGPGRRRAAGARAARGLPEARGFLRGTARRSSGRHHRGPPTGA